MDKDLLAAAILVVAASPLALWARMAQSGRWIELIVPDSAGLSAGQRVSLAPLISAGLWLHCGLLLLIPAALLVLPESGFKSVVVTVAVGLPVLSAGGAVLLKRRVRALKSPP